MLKIYKCNFPLKLNKTFMIVEHACKLIAYFWISFFANKNY